MDNGLLRTKIIAQCRMAVVHLAFVFLSLQRISPIAAIAMIFVTPNAMPTRMIAMTVFWSA
jgi:hypothetical protein